MLAAPRLRSDPSSSLGKWPSLPLQPTASDNFDGAVIGGWAHIPDLSVKNLGSIKFYLITGKNQPLPLDSELERTIKASMAAGHVAVGYVSEGYVFCVDLRTWVVRGPQANLLAGIRLVNTAVAAQCQGEERKTTYPRTDGDPLQARSCATSQAGGCQGVEVGHVKGAQQARQPQVIITEGVPTARLWVMVAGTWVLLPLSTQQQLARGHKKVFVLDVPGLTEAELPKEQRRCTVDLDLMVLCEMHTRRAYPLRVTRSADADARVVRQAGDLGQLVLYDLWNWAPGVITEYMATRPKAKSPVDPRHKSYEEVAASERGLQGLTNQLRDVLESRSAAGVAPVSAFSSCLTRGGAMEAYPIQETRRIVEDKQLEASRDAGRWHCLTTAKTDPGSVAPHEAFPFTGDDAAAEMQLAAQVDRVLPENMGCTCGVEHGDVRSRVLQLSDPSDKAKFDYVTKYMASTLHVGHVLEVMEVCNPSRRAALGGRRQAIARQLAQVTNAADTMERALGRHCSHHIRKAIAHARKAAAAQTASSGNMLGLWHGTGGADPVDVLVGDGPSLDHSRDDGYYGRATYASSSARYCHNNNYAHRCAPGKFMMTNVHQVLLLACVAGNVANVGTQQKLRLDTVRSTLKQELDFVLSQLPQKLSAKEVANVRDAWSFLAQPNSISGYSGVANPGSFQSHAERKFGFYKDMDTCPMFLVSYRV